MSETMQRLLRTFSQLRKLGRRVEAAGPSAGMPVEPDDASTSPDREASAIHEAEFGDAIVYFQYVWSGPGLPMHKVARLLLESGIAETVSSPADGEVRMAPRYQDLEAVRSSAEELIGFSEFVGRGQWGTALRRHPKIALRIARQTTRSKLGRRSREADSNPAEAGTSTAQRIGPDPDDLSGQQHGRDSRDASIVEGLEEVIRNITESVALRQLESAVMHTREQDHYRPSYLGDEPYLRLRLRDLRFAVADGDDPDFDPGQRASVHLLVHRSGVNQIMMACRLPDGVTTSDVLGRLRSKSVALKWSEMAEPILRPMVRRAKAARWRRPWLGPAMQLTGQWLEEEEEGVRWRHFEGSGESLSNAFEVYLGAIEDVVGYQLAGNTWMSYPSVFLQPRCCADEQEFRSAHAQELVAILVDHKEVELLRDATRLNVPDDSSILRDHSVWFTHAQLTNIDWSDHEKRARFDSHLHDLLVTENFLLQMWQIRSLAADMQAADTAGVSPRATQRTLIHGLTEFYDSQLSFGTANDIVRKLREESGVDRLHDHLVDRVDQLGSLTAARRAEEAATRSSLVGLAAIAATVLLALPAITETLDAAERLPATGWTGVTTSPLRWIAGFGSTGAWVTYLVVIVLLIALWCATSLRLRLRRRRDHRRERGPRSAGVAWPEGTIRIERVD